MPFVGFQCPMVCDVVAPDDCLNCANNEHTRECHYPGWLIQECINFDRERDSFSPTTLLGCYRQYALRRISNYSIVPALEVPKLRGTMLHNYVERSCHPDYILREFKLSKQIVVDGIPFEINGIVDEYNTNTQHLIDYKTVSYLGKELKESNKPIYLKQLSMYRWLMYPTYPVISAEIAMIDSKTPWRKGYNLWTPDKTETWMRAQIRALKSIYQEGYMPEVLDEEDQWKCLNCEVREACNSRAMDDGEAPPNPEDRQKKYTPNKYAKRK